MWSVPPSAFADLIDEELDAMYRGIAITLLNNLILRSPVDTGRYRANHLLTFGAITNDTTTMTDKNGGVTLSAATGQINGLPQGVRPVIYIQNNLPYAIRLENGWSQQAAQGVYGLAFEDTLRAYT